MRSKRDGELAEISLTFLFLVGAAALIMVMPAFAQEDKTESGTGGPVSDAIDKSDGTAAKIDLVLPSTASGAAASGSASTAGRQNGVPEGTVAPGPLVEARGILFTRIQQAKQEGIGIGSYLTAFNSIEDSVRNGQGAEQLRPRIESLARALKDQLDKSKILKTQRPTPPSPSQSGAASSAPVSSSGSSLTSDSSIAKIKERFDNIPDSMKDKILHSDKAREIMQKLGL